MKQVSFLFVIATILGFFSCRPPVIKCDPPLPPKISGPNTVNIGETITLTVAASGGTWSSSSPANATVSSTGVVTGIAAGTMSILYTLPDGGCGAVRSYHNITVTNTTIAVGQSYGGGIIAYILQPGDPGYDANVKHGLIAAPTDQTNARWSDGLTTGPTNATGTAIGTGWTNTNTIMLKYGITGDFAAVRCRHVTAGGNNDWYLPSKDELNKLYENRAAIGGFGTGAYWSSTEFDENQAWYQMFSAPTVLGSENKNVSYSVRAVRSF